MDCSSNINAIFKVIKIEELGEKKQDIINFIFSSENIAKFIHYGHDIEYIFSVIKIEELGEKKEELINFIFSKKNICDFIESMWNIKDIFSVIKDFNDREKLLKLFFGYKNRFIYLNYGLLEIDKRKIKRREPSIASIMYGIKEMGSIAEQYMDIIDTYLGNFNNEELASLKNEYEKEHKKEPEEIIRSESNINSNSQLLNSSGTNVVVIPNLEVIPLPFQEEANEQNLGIQNNGPQNLQIQNHRQQNLGIQNNQPQKSETQKFEPQNKKQNKLTFRGILDNIAAKARDLMEKIYTWIRNIFKIKIKNKVSSGYQRIIYNSNHREIKSSEVPIIRPNNPNLMNPMNPNLMNPNLMNPNLMNPNTMNPNPIFKPNLQTERHQINKKDK